MRRSWRGSNPRRPPRRRRVCRGKHGGVTGLRRRVGFGTHILAARLAPDWPKRLRSLACWGRKARLRQQDRSLSSFALDLLVATQQLVSYFIPTWNEVDSASFNSAFPIRSPRWSGFEIVIMHFAMYRSNTSDSSKLSLLQRPILNNLFRRLLANLAAIETSVITTVWLVSAFHPSRVASIEHWHDRGGQIFAWVKEVNTNDFSRVAGLPASHPLKSLEYLSIWGSGKN